MTAVDIRRDLVHALRFDLVGPENGSALESGGNPVVISRSLGDPCPLVTWTPPNPAGARPEGDRRLVGSLLARLRTTTFIARSRPGVA
jgi:hypothetical protein